MPRKCLFYLFRKLIGQQFDRQKLIRRQHFRPTVNDVTCNFAIHFCNKIKLRHKRRERSQFMYQQMLSIAGGMI
ncbi:MAG: hypothetical protein K2P22_00785 [Lachnospiraceae bacterium]|nr:hypothetical protein [Lachnospiraceae bacterium]